MTPIRGLVHLGQIYGASLVHVFLLDRLCNTKWNRIFIEFHVNMADVKKVYG